MKKMVRFKHQFHYGLSSKIDEWVSLWIKGSCQLLRKVKNLRHWTMSKKLMTYKSILTAHDESVWGLMKIEIGGGMPLKANVFFWRYCCFGFGFIAGATTKSMLERVGFLPFGRQDIKNIFGIS
jgi:hypothetical protein